MVNRPTLTDSDSDWEEEATIKQSYNPRTYATELFLLLYSILLQGVPQLRSHFVLLVFSASRAHTEVHFTIFQ